MGATYIRTALIGLVAASAFACGSGGGGEPGEDDGGSVGGDVTPPQISNVTITAESDTSARISWDTNELAVGRVDWGLDTDYGDFAQDLTNLTTVHAFVLTDLIPGSEYHFNVTSIDEALNVGQTGDGTFFVSDEGAPVISNIVVLQLNEMSVSIGWTTDEPATSRVDYGTTTAYGDFVQDMAPKTNHTLILGGLTSATEYHFIITSIDDFLNVGQTGDSTFFVSDSSAPIISDVVVSAASETSATISWTTNEPATSRVDYGLTPAYGSFLQNPALTTNHTLVLTGLTPATQYHFRITSVDDELNVGQTADDTFTTPDDTGPLISNIVITPASDTSAIVSWITDEPAVSRIDYGTTTAYGSFVQDLNNVTTVHSLTLTGLTPNTQYHYNITCIDQSLNVGQSGDDTFITTDSAPPTISNVIVTPAGGTNATVSWTTDEPSTSRVDYGTTTAYGSFVQDLTNFTTSHFLVLTGLTPGTSYHFVVTSVDVALNVAQTGDDTFSNPDPGGGGELTGAMIAWQPLTLTFHGPTASELDDEPNPFLDYRIFIQFFGPSGQSYNVWGYFDGDGNGNGTGDVWRARFAPDEAGQWNYLARFHEGTNIATSFGTSTGTPSHFDGATGSFSILPRDPGAPGFYKWGLLEYVGEHYLKFRDGPYFIKGGSDSPENLLGYKGFDNTFDQPGGAGTDGLQNGLHRYLPHVGDWVPGNPLFSSADTGYDSKGLIGALNYLSSAHVNSVYFLPMNLGGDGQETYPFVSAMNTAFDRTHYDISKLRQWDMVFEHAQRKGILLHFVLAETEPANETFLDNGFLGFERRLFYKELVARFGHHLAIKWNLGEEIDYSTDLLRDFAENIQGLDPYDHPITFHTRTLNSSGSYPKYTAVLGDTRFSMTSIQASPDDMGHHIEKWRNDSAAAGRKWVVEADEQNEGLTNTNESTLRRKSLYDVYFSGGNVEWYFGYFDLPLGGDLRTEDFRTRSEMWGYMWNARNYMQTHLPFWEMQPADHLVFGESGDYGGAEVFSKHDSVYAIYLPATHNTGTLDLAGTSGVFLKTWYNPRTGGFEGSPEAVSGGGFVSIGPPPGGGSSLDWVVGFKK